jgi:hypothetical protein
MNEHPILFSGEMVKAILEDRKTQTRRVLKKQPIDILPMKVPNMWVILETRDPSHGGVIGCRYGRIGDHLWVRETWRCEELASGQDGVRFAADNSFHKIENTVAASDAWLESYLSDKPDKWRPSIFMPRWASRISLEVVNIRVERVQQISREDAKAEGMSHVWDWNKDRYKKHPEHFTRGVLNPYVANYSVLWDELNAKRGFGWDVDPWVWVIEFKRLQDGI